MYTKFEILLIFKSIKTIDDYDNVCDTFHWLIKNGYVERTDFLHKTALYYFEIIYK